MATAPVTDQDWNALALRAGSVFTPTSPINAQELFAGRDQQLREIVDVINQLGQHAVLYGERGVGKTSLANVFAGYLGRQNVLAPRVNCDATDTFDTVWRKAVEQAGLTRTRQRAGFVPQNDRELVETWKLLGDVATPDSVRRCLTQLSQHFVPVFVIDEFDRLALSERRVFADTIKALSDSAVPATILLVGVAENVEELVEEHHSVQRALAQVRMPRMSAEEIQGVLRKGTQKLGLKMLPAAEKLMTKLSRGLPHYAHLLGLHAVRAAVDKRSLEINPDHVRAALDRALTGAQHSILNAYETAIRSARKDNLFGMVLLACATAETNELGEFAAQDVRERLSVIAGRRLEIPSFAQHLKEFTEAKRGKVLSKDGLARLYRYKFSDPLLQPYVILRGLKADLITLADLD